MLALHAVKESGKSIKPSNQKNTSKKKKKERKKTDIFQIIYGNEGEVSSNWDMVLNYGLEFAGRSSVIT